jgi:hypothetical protein
MQQLAQHIGIAMSKELVIDYNTDRPGPRNMDRPGLPPSLTDRPPALTSKPLRTRMALADAPSQTLKEPTSDAPKTKKKKKRKVRHAPAAELVPVEAPKKTATAAELVPVEAPKKKTGKKRKHAHAPLASGVGGPDPVEAPEKKKGKKSGVGGPDATSMAASMFTKLMHRDAKKKSKGKNDTTGKKTKGKKTAKGKTETTGKAATKGNMALKRPAAAPKAPKIPVLGCSKCRYLKFGCTACRIRRDKIVKELGIVDPLFG